MRNPLPIGQKEYKFKKDALAYYQQILNSYSFGQSLSTLDLDDLVDLINYDSDITKTNNNIHDYLDDVVTNVVENSEVVEKAEEEVFIEDIKVSRVQYDTKCFEVFLSDKTSWCLSYILMINNTHYPPEKLFQKACRNTIASDLRSVKQEYFNKNSIKGQVKCQETGILSRWEELVVDHRQPNTFSMIVERFKEAKNIDLDSVDYQTDDQNLLQFYEPELADNFRTYHKEKSSLRIVRKECNSSRSGMARVKRSSKDLLIT